MGALLTEFAELGVRFQRLPDGNLRALRSLTDDLRTLIRDAKLELLRELAANDEPRYWWRVEGYDCGQGPIGFDFCSLPELTRAEVERRYPGATALEPGPSDNRRTCRQCRRLSDRGQCRASDAGIRLVGCGPLHSPAADVPRRCEGYLPRPDDADERPGIERWPALVKESP